MAGITQRERERRDRLYERGLKQCSTCYEPLSLSAFAHRHDGYRGLDGTCRHCRNAANAEWQRNNPEKAAAKAKRWRDADLDRAHVVAKWYRTRVSLMDKGVMPR